MIFKVVVAEKPSVASDIARVLGAKQRKNGFYEGNGYKVTWCVGHLVGLSYPEAYDSKYKKWDLENLPFIPEEIKTEVLKSTKEQFDIIKGLLNDKETTEVICATDSAREGQYIFNLTYDKAKCKKPVKRLWISSMTDEAITEGFKNLKDGENYINLYESARCRAISDYLIGLNSTRGYSVKYNNFLSIGRVQTPTLSIIVQRHLEIENFAPEKYFEIEANFGEYKGIWKHENESKIQDENKANTIVEKVKGEKGKVADIITEEKSKPNPLLYDLTELQRDCNKIFGYSAQETLDIAQNLYEKHKLTTYPRTDSRYLSEDMIPTFKEILINIKTPRLSKYIDEIIKDIKITKRIVDNSKITDHHAIIPTNKIPKLEALNEREKNVYQLISTRFVSVFLPKHEYLETIVTTSVQGENFISKGKIIKQLGWLELEGNLNKDNEEKEQKLPDLSKDMIVDVVDAIKQTKFTTAKKPHNEATLLSAMENSGRMIEDEELREQLKGKGIGTPATRSSIIEKLIKADYIKREKKNLIPTEKGIKLIELVPDVLKTPETTGEWELQLNNIAKGQVNPEDFMKKIKELTSKIIEDIKGESSTVKFEKKEKAQTETKEIIGVCPRCKKNIYENAKSFYCEGYKDTPKCSFSLWKEDKFFTDKGKKITKTIAKQLLKNSKASVKGFKKKDGTATYDADVLLNDTGKYINFKLEFSKK